MYLSGNFGEIRSDHFHSGIDIKTQGTIGHHVFSIDDGYVSRIKVQANGYGKSIYIAHPNGYTSVYGHLDQYRDDIAEFVKRIQYKRRSFMVDLYLEPHQFKLEKGEFIAYSGNSGGSSGPHLHFEVRTSDDQHPTNVLHYGFDIKDKRAPRFNNLIINPVGASGLINGENNKFISRLVPDQGIYTIPYGTSITASGEIGLAVEVFDYLDGATNRCGVYSLQLFVDDELKYSQIMDEFSFSETRYINAHIDYGAKTLHDIRAHRLHRLPNNRLRIYKDLVQEGILNINEEKLHSIRIVATDVAGNKSEAVFKLKGDTNHKSVEKTDQNQAHPMKFEESNHFREGKVTVDIPANAFYEDIEFQFASETALPGTLSELYHIHRAEVPVHRPYTLSISAEGIDPVLYNKLLIVSQGEDNNNEPEAEGGEFINGKVVASLRTFGSFAISVDTIAPVIKALNGSSQENLRGKKSMKFSITDSLSGIEKYEGYIDNQWALFEYDPKNDLLSYYFDESRISKGVQHELELYISDAKGNVNLFHTTFTW